MRFSKDRRRLPRGGENGGFGTLCAGLGERASVRVGCVRACVCVCVICGEKEFSPGCDCRHDFSRSPTFGRNLSVPSESWLFTTVGANNTWSERVEKKHLWRKWDKAERGRIGDIRTRTPVAKCWAFVDFLCVAVVDVRTKLVRSPEKSKQIEPDPEKNRSRLNRPRVLLLFSLRGKCTHGRVNLQRPGRSPWMRCCNLRPAWFHIWCASTAR
jgi:hypothetical protein